MKTHQAISIKCCQVLVMLSNTSVRHSLSLVTFTTCNHLCPILQLLKVPASCKSNLCTHPNIQRKPSVLVFTEIFLSVHFVLNFYLFYSITTTDFDVSDEDLVRLINPKQWLCIKQKEKKALC